MRLTLRLLLNWINHNLAESDAVLIEQKVEESELAKLLNAQIHNVMALQRLAAPSPLDGTPKGNANATAEYLDNSMDSKSTPDFEKFCIHSEVMLGEIASCHQILSRVLTQKLEFSPELRANLCGLYRFIDANNESSIPRLSRPQYESELEDLFDEMPASSFDPVPEETQKKDAGTDEEEIQGQNAWKFAFFVLLGLNILYCLGKVFGLLP